MPSASSPSDGSHAARGWFETKRSQAFLAAGALVLGALISGLFQYLSSRPESALSTARMELVQFAIERNSSAFEETQVSQTPEITDPPIATRHFTPNDLWMEIVEGTFRTATGPSPEPALKDGLTKLNPVFSITFLNKGTGPATLHAANVFVHWATEDGGSAEARPPDAVAVPATAEYELDLTVFSVLDGLPGHWVATNLVPPVKIEPGGTARILMKLVRRESTFLGQSFDVPTAYKMQLGFEFANAETPRITTDAFTIRF